MSDAEAEAAAARRKTIAERMLIGVEGRDATVSEGFDEGAEGITRKEGNLGGVRDLEC